MISARPSCSYLSFFCFVTLLFGNSMNMNRPAKAFVIVNDYSQSQKEDEIDMKENLDILLVQHVRSIHNKIKTRQKKTTLKKEVLVKEKRAHQNIHRGGAFKQPIIAFRSDYIPNVASKQKIGNTIESDIDSNLNDGTNAISNDIAISESKSTIANKNDMNGISMIRRQRQKKQKSSPTIGSNKKITPMVANTSMNTTDEERRFIKKLLKNTSFVSPSSSATLKSPFDSSDILRSSIGKNILDEEHS